MPKTMLKFEVDQRWLIRMIKKYSYANEKLKRIYNLKEREAKEKELSEKLIKECKKVRIKTIKAL